MERKMVVNPGCSTNQATAVMTPGPGHNYAHTIMRADLEKNVETLDEQRKKKCHCRFCGEEKKCEELLDLTIDKETMERYLMILDFFKIEFLDLSNEKIPKTTCENCYDMIGKCYNFFQKVKESQVVLNQFYGVKKEVCDDANFIKVEVVEENFEANTEFEDCQMPNENNFINPESISTPGPSQSSNRVHVKNELFQSNVALDLKDYSTNAYPRMKNNLNKLPETIHSNNNETKTSALIVDSDDDDDHSSDSKSENDVTLQYGGVPIYLNTEVDTGLDSWDSYSYSCKHCYEVFHCMDDLREHGMQLHKTCRVFECADCKGIDVFNTFDAFIAHVREHRDKLRYYCSHCNKHFESISECSNHEISHSSSGQICDWCGEICPGVNALKRHKGIKHFKPRVVTPVRLYNGITVSLTEADAAGTWNEYEWACHACNLRCTDVQALREHTQSAHGKCFLMKCADCSRLVSNYRIFAAHVAGHRPHLKKYCPYCNQRFEDTSEFKKHVDGHYFSSQRPCDGCGRIFPNKDLEAQHMKQFSPKRQSKFLTTEDLTCDICNKLFKSIPYLNKHREVHMENRPKHICFTCGKQFVVKSALVEHISIKHSNKEKFVCLICNKSVSSKPKLKAHVVRHESRPTCFCNTCGKGFYGKGSLVQHMATHTDIDTSKYKCVICSKVFRWSSALKNHMNVHTNAKPFKCHDCSKCFNSWSNCNKHMIRIHGTSLSKTKLTDQGKVPEIRVEKVKHLGSDQKEWMQDLFKSRRSRKINGGDTKQ